MRAASSFEPLATLVPRLCSLAPGLSRADQRMEFSIQVLKELYAESNQIGYIGRMECDAQPVLSEALVRVKLAEQIKE